MDESEIPPGIQHLHDLNFLYVDHRHLRPLRQGYCQERFPTPMQGKYNFIIVQQDYRKLVSTPCEELYSTEFAFKPLQESGVYPD